MLSPAQSVSTDIIKESFTFDSKFLLFGVLSEALNYVKDSSLIAENHNVSECGLSNS